jgi:hypothetical protein
LGYIVGTYELLGRDYLAILMFASFIGLLFLGFPVAWTLAGLAILFTAIGIIADIDLGIPVGIDWAYTSLRVDRTWDIMKNWVFVALPMFIFMGIMLDRSGVAERMMMSFSRLFSHVRGGLAVAIALIGILFAASTGIVGASVTLLVLLGLPVTLGARYQPELATGTIAASGRWAFCSRTKSAGPNSSDRGRAFRARRRPARLRAGRAQCGRPSHRVAQGEAPLDHFCCCWPVGREADRGGPALGRRRNI